ncbi:MAG: glycosyltransferase, partial [Lachnospiraceae bacterium]|nr:glycosyltransferase [Lachnospiraceae bacterium]
MISVILPAYNEEENIEPAVKEISAVLEGCGEDFELLFVSDGSTDSTYEKIRTMS